MPKSPSIAPSPTNSVKGADQVQPDCAHLFLALWPSTGLQRDLHRWGTPFTQAAPSATVAPEKIHLTLHFIGAMPRDRLAALSAALGQPMAPFALSFSRCERWPRGLLVTVPDVVPQALNDLHIVLWAALRQCGLSIEKRAFKPHLTLARKYTGALPPVRTPPLRWSASGYVLVESCPGPRSKYIVLRAYP